LIGIFVTTENLDLFDFDAWVGDNLNSMNGGEITVDYESQKYQGRLYATEKIETSIHEVTGETVGESKFVFEGVPGFLLYLATKVDMEAEARGEPYSYTIFSVSSEAISDTFISSHFTDNSRSITIEGTVFVVISNQDYIFFGHPVYQDADGRVYIVSRGPGFLVDGESSSEGAVHSQTIDNTTTVTENGRVTTDSSAVKLHVSIMYEPVKIVFLQMDADGGLLSRKEYAPGATPESLTPEDETAYIIAETHKKGDKGSPLVSREIFGRDSENIETFAAGEDGICVKHLTEIIWG
jgi:hypothetical protein